MERTKSFISVVTGLVFTVVFIVPFRCAYSQEAVMPAGVVEEKPILSEEKIPYVKPGYVTVNFKGADIRAVLNYLSEVSGVDIVPSPEVTGTVDLKLSNKPWKVALDIIVKNYGYAYEREGDIIRVVTIASLKLEELSTEVIPLNYASAEAAQEAVKDMLTERGKLTFDSRINALVVTDLATNIYKIKNVVEELDEKTPQIMIEAKIIETTLSDTEKLGIDWNLVIEARGAVRPTTLPFTFQGYLPGFTPEDWNRYMPRVEGTTTTTYTLEGGGTVSDTDSPFPIGLGIASQDADSPFPFALTTDFSYGTLDFSQFSAVLRYLNERSDTDIISNPRITTLNNKEATMFVGRVYNFPVFNQVEDTGKWVISGYDGKDLGIKLVVVPHVNENNEIVVELKPEISNYLGLEQITEELRAPMWSTREAETQVMVRDGDTIFIGGLITENTREIDKKFPLLGDLIGDVPFIGNIVKYKEDEKRKTELIIFLTVHIVKDMDTLMRIATKGIEEIRIPLDAVEPVPLSEEKKRRRPLFDFRKKKKE